ncbi:MAG: GtrA family protein [Oscillospiraceae bacterium]|nr:GtrA family protein [Oscillospiraceae bacterium]
MLKQFLGFAAVGVTGAGVNFIIYNFLLRLFESLSILGQHNYIFALLISFSLSILWCFVFSRRFVFNSVDESSVPWYRALLRMYLSYAFTGILFNVFMSVLWVDVLGVPKPLVSLVNDTLAAPVNFLLIKFWSFGKK